MRRPELPQSLTMMSLNFLLSLNLNTDIRSFRSLLRYRLSRCYLAHGQTKEAMMTLETICMRKRSAKVSLALANLYENTGQERGAVQCYKDVLKEYLGKFT